MRCYPLPHHPPILPSINHLPLTSCLSHGTPHLTRQSDSLSSPGGEIHADTCFVFQTKLRTSFKAGWPELKSCVEMQSNLLRPGWLRYCNKLFFLQNLRTNPGVDCLIKYLIINIYHLPLTSCLSHGTPRLTRQSGRLLARSRNSS